VSTLIDRLRGAIQVTSPQAPAAPQTPAAPHAPAAPQTLAAQTANVQAPARPTATPAPNPDATATTATTSAPAAHHDTSAQTDSDPHAQAQPHQTAPLVPVAVTRATSAPFTVPTSGAPVTLPRAGQALQETITLAARQGASLARIQLSPESLGPINIHLQHTADGVVARVLAGPEAAQQLQQGAADLRQSLQDSGVNLIGLQIETSGRDAGAQAQAQNQSSPGRRSAAPTDTQDGAPTDPTTSIASLEPLHGASISVLA
jgi:flagellar hook-length control protein FliK